MPQLSAAEIQVRYARIAGFVYLLLIVLFMGGQLLISHVTGTGDFAARLQHIAQGQWLYSVGLVLELLASLLTVLLAYALYVVLRPVNERIAHLALYWRLGEAFSGLLTFTSFAILRLQSDPKYLQSLGMVKIEAIIDLARSADFASFNITTLFFSFGSTLFFWLFLQTRYIPRALSAFGVFASLVTMLVSLADLIFPAHADVIQFGWIPIFIAEISTGIWLLARGVRIEPLPQ
ncbi:MAG: DUF4386 domain-containing protein [Rudaea sp.]